ncbi:heme peroxidase [Cynara cardunculus var. scolymus]|uniref:peroxidase n=1 Tax=Cynara cardunculus var. scolymus TaxID=59895 RepID=A0A103XFV6_CYNCS|nr:heme peroxidase [Cynara cardunculus var. scolymus]
MNYYKKQCGSVVVENTIKEIVWSKVAESPALAAKLLRLHYHDCFVRGCDASILLDPAQNKTAEKTAGPNRSVSGYDVIDEIKTTLEASCPGIVSCADILALAARDAVSFQNPTTALEMDPNSALSFDSDYFRSLNKHKGLFVSDAALLTNQESAMVVKSLENPMVFFAKFARSMVRMGAIEVLTDVENTVRDIVWKKVEENPAMAAKLLRLHYHDCFVRGCDGSILLDPVQNTTTEKTAGPNRSVTGYDIIDEIKTTLETECPGIVSCADIVALAARDAVSFQFKTEMWPVFTGREDGKVSLAAEVGANLPSANANFTTLLTQFGNKELNMDDLVILSGAHTIGNSRCVLVARRLYNFTGIGDVDPSLNATYAQTLRKICPNPQNPATTLEMDPDSSLTFDSDYFRSLNQHKGLFVSDAALLTNQQSAQMTEVLQNPDVFFARFARSMVRMGAIEVLTEGQGEVRKSCRVINSQ